MVRVEVEKNEPPPGGVDSDVILVEEVGQFGRYQLMTLAFITLPVIFGGFNAGEFIFTTARIPTRCRIPECDGDASLTQHPEFRPPWILDAIPGSSLDEFESCERYAYQSPRPPQHGNCSAALFDTSHQMECQEYVYENTLTIVYDFELACQEWKRSRIGSYFIMGAMLSLPLTGYVSDRWGRRVALSIGAFNMAWAGLMRSFANSYEWFLALEILEAALGGGTFSSCYVLVMELVGPKYRVIAGPCISTMFALGQVILGFIAWGVPSWRPLTRVLYAPQLLVISYYWILPESVRWLLSKGRYEESEAILKKIAKVNKKTLSDKSLEALRSTAETKRASEDGKEPWLPVLVFKSRVILSRCIIVPTWWITNTLIYYGMNINAVNLSGNQYLNYVYVAGIEIPGYWTAILLLDMIGRKPLLICAYWLCAACQFIFAFMPEGVENLSMAVYLIGKYCIAIVMTSLYVYTAELFPTKYRHSLLAFASMIGRLGSIVSPITPALAQEVWESLPPVLYGCFALVSGMLVFTTPETLRIKLPDTIEEAETLNDRKMNAKSQQS